METAGPAVAGSVRFGALLKRYRLAAGLSQEALAERARLSVRAISAYERGQRQAPYRDTVALLARALDLRPEEASTLEAAVPRRRGPLGAAARTALEGPLQAEPAGQPPPAAGGAVLPALVGRAQELAVLDRHLRGDGPPVLLLAGEPGIGKSRLLQEVARRAGTRGWRVLAGGCTRAGGQQPFAPLLQALQRYLAARTPAERRLDLRGCAWLVRILPELAEEIEPLPRWTIAPAQERRLMFEAVRHLLANVATPVGTLLLLDDLQWAGADALDLLGSLVHHPPDAPLRIVGAYRDTEVPPEQPLNVLLAELAEAQLALERPLHPLAHGEAEDLFAQLCGGRERAEPALVAQVVRRVGGVPFFLVSYARGPEDAGGDAAMRRGLPWDLRQSLQRRLLALPEAGRALVDAAAVAGRVTPRSLLLTVLARPEPEVLDALESACRAGVLQEVGDDAYGFVHDVIREVAESALGQARRALLHRRIAEALEGRSGAAPADILAFHYTRSDAREKALEYLMLAGDNAAAAYAHQAALAAYAQALEVCDKLGDTALAVACAAAQKRANIHVLVGNFAAAVADYERMRASAHRLGDRRLEGLALAHRAGAELDDHAFTAAEQTLRAALTIAEEGYADVRLGALVGLVAHHVVSAGRLTEAETALRAAEEVAPRVPEPAMYLPWSPDLWRSWLANWAGRFDEAIAAAVRAPRIGEGWDEALARGGKGDYQRALTLLMEVLAAHKRRGTVPHEAYNTLGWIYGEIQDHEQALEWNTRALAAALETDLRGVHFECLNHARLNLGDTLMALGRLHEAEEQFRAVEQAVRHPPDAWMLWRYAQHFFHSYGELWLTRGDATMALSYADECLHLAEQTGSRKNIVKGRRLRGQALLAQGRLAVAEQELVRALEVAEEVGNPPQLWKTHLTLGDLRTARGRPDEAHTSYSAALAIIDGVAAALEDDGLRETFLASAHVQHVRRRAQ